jgi:hypothetical protein
VVAGRLVRVVAAGMNFTDRTVINVVEPPS